MRSILFVLGCGCYDWSDAAAGARCAPLRVIHVFQHSAEPGQHRTIPALRLKHRSGSCGTASALPKCSIMSGCGTRIVLRGQKPLALCDRCPCFGLLFPPLAALTFAASSIICAFGLASAAPRSPYRHLELCGIALKICILPGRNNGVTYLTGKAPGIKFICRGRCSSSACMAGRKWHFTLKYCKRSRAHNARPCGVK